MNTKTYSRIILGGLILLMSAGFLICASPPLWARDFQVMTDLRVDGNVNTPYGGVGRYQNLLIYSEQFDNAAWEKGSVSVAIDAVSPDGRSNSAATVTTSATVHYFRQQVTVTASTEYTFSWWAKQGSMSTVKYSVYNISGSADIVSATAYSVGSSWQRFSVTFTTPAGCTLIGVYPVRDSGVTGTVYAWGAQLEQASGMGVYVKTIASVVTASRGIISDNDAIIRGNLIVDGTITGLTATAGGWTDNGTNVYLTTTGDNVGIGTTGPGAKLEVAGNIRLPNSAGYLEWKDGSGNPNIGMYATGNDLAMYAGNINRMKIGTAGGVAIGDSTYMSATPPVDGVIIKGNVGIGTTTPVKTLHVAGQGVFGDSVTAALAARALNLISSDAVMRIYRISGISTNDASVELMTADDTSETNKKHWDFYLKKSSDSFSIRRRTGGDLNVMTLTTTGNVGIGTTGPLQKLHVDGKCVTGDTLLPVIRAEKGMDEQQIRELWAISKLSQLTNTAGTPKIGETRELGATETRELKLANRGIASAATFGGEPRNDKVGVEFVPIVDVKAGDYVLSLNEATGKIEPARINGLLDMGVKPVFKLTTASGRSIKTTGNHPYLTK